MRSNNETFESLEKLTSRSLLLSRLMSSRMDDLNTEISITENERAIDCFCKSVPRGWMSEDATHDQ